MGDKNDQPVGFVSSPFDHFAECHSQLVIIGFLKWTKLSASWICEFSIHNFVGSARDKKYGKYYSFNAAHSGTRMGC